jgi:homogentisate 1,2-dioxygenase
MNLLKTGRTTYQAHVGIPEGAFEEGHGRKCFFGKAARLYHTHPPTAWTRFEDSLGPGCFHFNALHPTDQDDPRGMPVPFLVSDDLIDTFRLDPDKLRAFGRMAGTTYSRTTDRFDIERP